MNGKYALALILALQVSMSLCEVPAPDAELVEKYEQLKSVFYKRLLNAYSKLHAAASPLVAQIGESGQGQAVRDSLDEVQGRPEFQAAVKIATGLGQEAVPLVEKARMSILGVYGHYLRPRIGTYLDSAITNIKVYLDQYLPAE